MTIATAASQTVSVRDQKGSARVGIFFLGGRTPVGNKGRRPGQGTEFTELADLAARLSQRARDEVEILLTAARPFADGFAPLQPLWDQEAMHRATSVLRLFATLQDRRNDRHLLPRTTDSNLALHLAGELGSLRDEGADARAPVLGTTARSCP